MLQMFVLALSLYNTRNRGVFLLCKITNLLIYRFNGEDITEKGFANHRRNHVSFIFQAYNLIDYMTPLENVKLTSKLPPEPVLEKMGLTKEEMKRNVLQLSGGQQQRVAIARALASEAPVILADVN